MRVMNVMQYYIRKINRNSQITFSYINMYVVRALRTN